VRRVGPAEGRWLMYHFRKYHLHINVCLRHLHTYKADMNTRVMRRVERYASCGPCMCQTSTDTHTCYNSRRVLLSSLLPCGSALPFTLLKILPSSILSGFHLAVRFAQLFALCEVLLLCVTPARESALLCTLFERFHDYSRLKERRWNIEHPSSCSLQIQNKLAS